MMLIEDTLVPLTETLPIHVGLLIGALVAIEFFIVDEKFASLSNACASSFNVSSAAGAFLTWSLILSSTYVLSTFRLKAF